MRAAESLGYFTIGVDLVSKPSCKPMVVYSGYGNLPFKDNVFDRIISQQVIEHVQDLDNYFKEAKRLLHHNGLFFAEFPTRLKPYDSHKQVWFKHWFKPPPEPWFCFRWPWEIKKIAKKYFHVKNATKSRLKSTSKLKPIFSCFFNQSWILE